MKVVFRADASTQIGSGHVMRCLTLADGLRDKGAEVRFVCRDLPGNLNRLIEEKGFNLSCLPAPEDDKAELDWNRHAAWLGVDWRQDAKETLACLQGFDEPVDWLVVDHYALDRQWEALMRPVVGKIMVIDDLADRQHDCDLLLDQNYFIDFVSRYEGLVPTACRKMLGPQYALLRPEFRAQRRGLRSRSGKIERLLVFFGGADPTDETSKALSAIRKMGLDNLSVDVVVGSTNRRRDEIQRLCRALPRTRFYCQVSNMAELFARADLALGAGGSTSWERFAVGTPTVMISIAFNQEQHARDLSDRGLIIYLGRSCQVDEHSIVKQMTRLFDSPKLLLNLESSGLALVDGLGAERLVGILMD